MHKYTCTHKKQESSSPAHPTIDVAHGAGLTAGQINQRLAGNSERNASLKANEGKDGGKAAQAEIGDAAGNVPNEFTSFAKCRP